MDPFDKPEHVSAVESFVGQLDGDELADNINAISGGCLRGRDALNVARLVSLTALRHRGRAILVAGLGAQWDHGKLNLFTGTEIASADIE